MDTITVPPARNATPHSAHWIAPELNTPSSVPPKILRLMRHADSGEYLQAPVIYAGPDNHFSGFRADRLKALISVAA